jgi:hypothetical protein
MSNPSGFTAFVPGFDFIKNLGEQAASWAQSAGAGPTAGAASQAMPGMAAWVAPTFDVEELEKRINDLKSVQFWLDQNARALAATIQALEVQKMTLSTLKNMDMGMEDAVKAMQANPTDLWRQWQTGASAKPAEPTTADTTQADKAQAVDPMQWWGALSQQFQSIAQNAANDIAKASEQAEALMKAAAQNVTPTPAKKAPKATAKRAKKPAVKPSAKSTAVKTRKRNT